MISNNILKFRYHLSFLHKGIKYRLNDSCFLSSYDHNKINRIKIEEEVNNIEEAFIRRIPKMNNTALAYTCEEINKNQIKNLFLWELIYERIKEINNSFTAIELTLIFHAYCKSKSFNKQNEKFITFMWVSLEPHIENLNYCSLIALYYCAEKTTNEQKIKEIGNYLIKQTIKDLENIKLSEMGLMILVKALCTINDSVDIKFIQKVCELIIYKVEIKGWTNILLCFQFFLKYKIFNNHFLYLLKKIQLLIILKKINPHVVLEYFTRINNIEDPVTIKEIKNTLSIIYLSHKKNT